MSKKSLIIASLAAVLLLGASCSSNSKQAPVNPAPANTNNVLVPINVPATTDNVTIQNFAFSPQTLTIKSGATVTWTNMDSAPHRIKSDTFNSNNLSQGQSFEYKFNTPGTYDYYCSIHPSMSGQIIVQ